MFQNCSTTRIKYNMKIFLPKISVALNISDFHFLDSSLFKTIYISQQYNSVLHCKVPCIWYYTCSVLYYGKNQQYRCMIFVLIHSNLSCTNGLPQEGGKNWFISIILITCIYISILYFRVLYSYCLNNDKRETMAHSTVLVMSFRPLFQCPALTHNFLPLPKESTTLTWSLTPTQH